MELHGLKKIINGHMGHFHCRQIHDEASRKEVVFRHTYEPPQASNDIPDVGKLRDFYDTFSELTLYYDEISGDSAIFIACPDQWASLRILFTDWLEGLDEEEEEGLLPEWLGDYIVIGEVPASGNYFLMPTKGVKAGYIFEFEHDGFEFIEMATDIESFITKALNLDGEGLMNIASHMRFIESEDYSKQWWIVEMRDSFGKVVKTEAE